MENKALLTSTILDMARKNAKFNTRKSKLNKKWTRYLKNKKLFDEYMVYLSDFGVVGAEPHTYKQLSNLCFNLSRRSFFIGSSTISVNWVDEFYKFAYDSIKWYDIKNWFLYWINKGYK